MKIKVISQGATTIDADADYQEPQIRDALFMVKEGEAGAAFVGEIIVDYTDSERSDISHDEYAIVTDDGAVLWEGWLDGADRPKPPDPIALGRLAGNWEAAAREESALADHGPWGNRGEHGNRAALLRDCARQLGAALGQAS